MRSFVALAALLAAVPASAQKKPLDGLGLSEGLTHELASFREGHEAARIDQGPVDELFERLSTPWAGHDASLSGLRPPRKDGAQEGVAVSLIEAPCEPPAGSVVYLRYDRCFSRLKARSELWSSLPGGDTRIVIWDFDIGLDGTLLAARKETRVGKMIDETRGSDGLKVDPKRGKIEDKRPKDVDALAEWKDLAPKLRALRPSRSI